MPAFRAAYALLSAGLLTLTLGCSQPSLLCSDPANDDACAAAWQQLLTDARVPGVSVAVLQNFRLVEQWSLGTLADDDSRPITLTTPFQAGDLSMSVTALGTLVWLEQMDVHLDLTLNDTLRHWQIPDESGWGGDQVTVRHLLSHRSGLSPSGFRGYPAGSSLPTWQEMLNGTGVANSERVRLTAAPGENCNYSAAGYEVLSYWLEQQAQMSFASWQNSAVFTPLNIPARYQLIGLPPPAAGHDWRGNPLEGGYRRYAEQAALGLWATPTDLSRVMLEVMASARGQGRIITDPSLSSAMLTTQGCAWGLGWIVDRRGSETEFSMRGSTAGYRAYMIGQVRSGNGLVVMTNGDRGDRIIDAVVSAVRSAYNW